MKECTLRPTINDIAKLARVSKSTVSRVVNRSGAVSKNTREAVLLAVSALDYKPNEIARSLVLKRTNTICLIVQDIRNPYHAHASWYAERAFRKYGYSTIICNADNDPSLEEYYLNAMKYRNVDGILCMGGKGDARGIVKFKLGEDLPIVLVDREVKGLGISTVTLDNVYGGKLAVDYLFSLSHTRIAIVTSDYTEAEKQRLDGYILAHGARGVEPGEGLIVTQSEELWFNGECGGLMDLMNGVNRPTAIFATNDHKALQVIKIFRKNSIRIPDDVSVVGYDDIEFASLVHPSLTTVHQPVDAMIEAGVDTLVKQLNSEESASVHLIMKPWLVTRESTKAVSSSGRFSSMQN